MTLHQYITYRFMEAGIALCIVIALVLVVAVWHYGHKAIDRVVRGWSR